MRALSSSGSAKGQGFFVFGGRTWLGTSLCRLTEFELMPTLLWLKFAEVVYEAPTANGRQNPLDLGRLGADYNARP